MGKPKQIHSCLVVMKNKSRKVISKSKNCLQVLEPVFQERNINYELIKRTEIKNIEIDKWDLIVTLGGDKTFLRVANFLPEGSTILGVHTNSNSETYLLATSTSNVKDILFQIFDGELQPISLPRIKVRGRPFLALMDLYFGRNHGWRTAKYAILLEDESWEHQQSSGVIVTTGMGCTGGYGSISGGVFFSPLKPELRYIIWAPYLVGKLTTVTKTRGKIGKNNSLKIKNLVEKGMILSFDSNFEVSVELEEVIEITLEPSSLNVYNPLFYQPEGRI
ncbi:MAG: hypothetical protein ACFFBD_07205 [Candidatus Hodarchaeota archaeon]